MCCLAAIGTMFFIRQLINLDLKKVKSFYRSAAILTTLFLLVLYPSLSEMKHYMEGPSLARTLYGLNPFVEGESIGRYIAKHTRPEEKVLIFGSEGQILFHAERKSAWKYVFAYPLAGFHSQTLELQKEAFADIVENQPRYIVWVNLASSMVLNKNAPGYLFYQMNQYLLDQYTLEAVLVAVSPKKTKLITTGFSNWKGRKILFIFRRNKD
jgi:hypothetical protein